MNTQKEIMKSDEKISFQEKSILRKFVKEDLLTIDDADQNKMPSLKELLLKMYEFRRELESVGIRLGDVEGHGRKQKGYVLTMPKYAEQCRFNLNLTCDWFDIKECFALHAGFTFNLYVNQEIHPEISDWARIGIKRFSTKPYSWASERDYSGNRYLRGFYGGNIFFNGLDLGPEHRNGTDNADFSFKTDCFNKAVGDICLLLDHIISQKKEVFVYKKKKV